MSCIQWYYHPPDARSIEINPSQSTTILINVLLVYNCLVHHTVNTFIIIIIIIIIIISSSSSSSSSSIRIQMCNLVVDLCVLFPLLLVLLLLPP